MKNTQLHEFNPVESFQFNEEVAQIFDDMAVRSIPGYISHQCVMSDIALSYIKENRQASVIDLGCSTGETIAHLTQYAKQQHVDISQANVYATDYSSAMLSQCKKKLEMLESKWNNIIYKRLNIIDVRDFLDTIVLPHSLCDVILFHFVLQFIPIKHRADILHECWNATKKGGCLFIGEKLRHKNVMIQKQWETMQYNFKRNMGYTHREIELKKQSLEGVLISQYQDDFLAMISSLPNSEYYMYYAHGEFQCYVIYKK